MRTLAHLSGIPGPLKFKRRRRSRDESRTAILRRDAQDYLEIGIGVERAGYRLCAFNAAQMHGVLHRHLKNQSLHAGCGSLGCWFEWTQPYQGNRRPSWQSSAADTLASGMSRQRRVSLGASAHRGDSTATASISNRAPWTASSEMATSVLAGGADRLRYLFRTSRKVDRCVMSVR
jgi:hypothetical protein